MPAITAEYLGLTEATCEFWDFGGIDVSQAPQAQVAMLKEDLAQSRMTPTHLMDIGWYPEFDVEGEFVVTVVRAGDWDSPVFVGRASTWPGLRDSVRRGIFAANALAGLAPPGNVHPGESD